MLAASHTISIEVRGCPPDAKDLSDMRKRQVVVQLRTGPDLAGFDATMRLIGRLVLRGEKRCPDSSPQCLAEAWVDCL